MTKYLAQLRHGAFVQHIKDVLALISIALFVAAVFVWLDILSNLNVQGV